MAFDTAEISFRAVRLTRTGEIRNEAHILSLPVLDNSKKSFDKNAAGQITDLLLNLIMYIEYFNVLLVQKLEICS